eukprot:3546340-Amphidinium_carterae.1
MGGEGSCRDSWYGSSAASNSSSAALCCDTAFHDRLPSASMRYASAAVHPWDPDYDQSQRGKGVKC